MDNNITGLLSLLDSLQSSGKLPGNSLSPIMDWLKKMMGNGGNVNALGGGSGAFSTMMNPSSRPPAIGDIFHSMLGMGGGGSQDTTPRGPSMGPGMGGFPMNALGAAGQSNFNAPPSPGGLSFNRLPYFGAGAGGIYPQAGYLG